VQLDRQAFILVTGSAGRIGQAAVSALVAAGWRVRGFDRLPSPGTPDFVTGDLAHTETVRQAAAGATGVIHLGGVPDDEDFLTRLLPNNVIGSYNVLEAARLGGAKRVLVASSGQVNWWQQLEGPHPVRPQDAYTPREWYSVGKIFLETAGMTYARNYDLTVLAIRLGWCPRTPEHLAELEATPRGHDTYLSPADAGRFFARAMAADLEPGFHALYVASRPVRHRIFDLEPTRRLLGWEPTDQWPQGAAVGITE
jgi:nucleoside-diphosphate-sugar epimerase